MIDSHAHVAFEQFNGDREEVIKRAHGAGVKSWIEVGSNVNSSRRALKLASQVEGVYAAVGVHPNNQDIDGSAWEEIGGLLENEKVVAVGEVGLDYYRGGSFEEQMPSLGRFVELAVSCSRPIIFHVRSSDERDAHEDLLSFLDDLDKKRRPRGVIHMFSGTLEQAEHYLSLGLFLGVSGIVTFKNAGCLVEVVENVPLDNILVETDSPYVAPEPHRGQRNEPAYVRLVAEKVAQVKGVEVTEVERITEASMRDLFGITV